MRIAGFLLIALAVAGFFVGSFTVTETDQVAEVGPVEIETQDEHTIAITPLLSGAVALVGIGLLIADRQRRKG